MNENRISHLVKKKTGHLANPRIPQMADASEVFLLYNQKLEIRSSLRNRDKDDGHGAPK